MSDIKGISSSYCIQTILMEDDYKPVIQRQRRLNPKVQDVVKNKIVKLLDSGLIYLISDSSWVSPIQVVPKKGGMTIVLNDNNELIPSHTVIRCYFLKMNDDNFPRHGGRLYGSIHGQLFEGIVLGHKISGTGIEVDRAKIDVIAKFPYPTNVKGLLMKDAKFDFSNDCKKAFNILKEKLTTAPIIISLDWNVPFELMCDASDFVVGAVLGQGIDGKFKLIYYARKTLNNAQEHYTTTKKELLVIMDKKGAKNLAADHLSRLENPDLGTFTEEEITDKFPNKHLMILKIKLNEDEPCIHYFPLEVDMVTSKSTKSRMYTFSPVMVANSRKHHCRVRPYTQEVLVLSTNLEIQTKHYSLVFRNRRGDEARIKNT
ncbi:reverse transcriptase domain-containing protein [Tanacetum coccineum]